MALTYPWSVIGALVFTYALVLLYALSQRRLRLQRLFDARAGAIVVGAVAVLSVVFGLLPRNPWVAGVLSVLLVFLTASMGLSAIAGLYRIRQGLRVSTLSHVAVYLILLGGLFGAGDKQEVLVRAEPGRPAAVGETREGERVELPFMLVLNEFVLEEYPAAGPVDTLEIDGRIVTMPPRQPKRFASDVTLISGKGERRVDIAVNHPARLGPWRIYQSGYDRMAGRWSELLCVRDGWYPLIAGGLWLLLGAGVWMFITAGARRKKEEPR